MDEEIECRRETLVQLLRFPAILVCRFPWRWLRPAPLLLEMLLWRSRAGDSFRLAIASLEVAVWLLPQVLLTAI